MSNSKVRKQIEAQEARNKYIEAYKKKSDFQLNFAMCKAYFKGSVTSVLGVVEKILKMKYNLPWQEKFIRKALNDVRGQHNPLISIPQFKFEKKEYDILAEFVVKNFDKMMMDRKTNGDYPLGLRDIIERVDMLNSRT